MTNTERQELSKLILTASAEMNNNWEASRLLSNLIRQIESTGGERQRGEGVRFLHRVRNRLSQISPVESAIGIIEWSNGHDYIG